MYIKDKIEKSPTECRFINLFHCLIELNDQTLIKEAQVILRKHCLPELKLSRVLWSALVFLLLNSEEELEEFNLQRFGASDECLINIYPVFTACRKALLHKCNITKEGGIALSAALRPTSYLKELSLSANDLGEPEQKLLSAIQKDENFALEKLDYNKNSIMSEEIEDTVTAETTEEQKQKYFDSGDYNMAKAKINKNKQLPSAQTEKAEITGDHIPTPQDLPQRKTSLVASKLAG
ncbi:cAMP-regulated phosphoprotein 19-A [Bagarius yarrelli]|uniref:cAMP-regulated phosphoprotein 19-A n=1 Tax=Bagarius yarrelli TaxID=175774 RepID=A0A556VA62_BAGYA|nr:cAMP-regulated phosphoprotein 19-A [Bagarius yarrelli]